MQTETVDLDEAQAHFKEIVARVVSGIHVVLSVDQRPIVHLFPAGERIAGLHPGAMQTSDDFDAPLPDEFWVGGNEAASRYAYVHLVGQ